MYKAICVSALVLSCGNAVAGDMAKVNAGTPKPECQIHINNDRNMDMPGYEADWDGKPVCLPFMPTNQIAPPEYKGNFYIDEFTDKRIRERWRECKLDKSCFDAAMEGAKSFARVEKLDTGAVDPKGRIDPEGTVDLAAIRRPAYFGQSPYGEPIAESEPRTFTVEFTAPRDSYEIRHLKLAGDIKLRGWYIQGDGVADGTGQKKHGLVIVNNGGSGEITALDNPASKAFAVDPQTGKYGENKDDRLSEEIGMRHWRGIIHTINKAGLDVLVTDRRGNGVSGGKNGFNTAEQANDIFRELRQIDTGDGARILTPDGKTLTGAEVKGALMRGSKSSEIPIVVMGYSRGSYTAAFFMHKNFVENCDRDIPDGKCEPAAGMTNVKGAVLYGPNSAGLGYRVKGHDMIEAALREEFNTTYYIDSDVVAGIGKWPSMMITKGVWDYVEGLEGSLYAFQQMKGLKDIFVFLGQHGLNTQNPENMNIAGERIAAYARAAVLDLKEAPMANTPRDLKELVLSVPRHWELTSAPE